MRPGRSSEPPGKILRRMLDGLRHRGPDDRGEEKLSASSGTELFLGHQRLSVIDLSINAHQPMGNDDRAIWVSTNSEIYNFRELREELAGDYTFRSESDTEVLLRAYEKWGIDCLEKLRGMFAFAIWDAPRNRLFLARDRLGIKPLYYHSGPDTFLFASEVRAIKASGIITPALDSTGLYHYLTFGRLQSPQSLLGGVSELKPAHYLLIEKNKLLEKRYWNPIGYDPISESEHEVEERIRITLEEAVRFRLVADVPLGAFLSGGIDSGAVVALMSASGNPPKTLSVIFKEKSFDESEYSSQVADAFGTQHQDILLTQDELLNILPDAVSAMDQPTVDGINTYIISKFAREAGLTVALSGLGGDELFAGYDSFRMIPKLLRLEELATPLPRFLRNFAGSLFEKFLPQSDKDTKLLHLVRGKKSGAHVYFLFRSLFCEDQASKFFRDTALFQEELKKDFDATRTLLEDIKSIDEIAKISYLEMTHYMSNMLLRDTDMMSMAHSLEVRVPLIDHKLVELMLSVPGNMKLSGRGPKPLLVNALSGKLPHDVVHRKKMGFTLPFEEWMRGKLRNEMESVLLTPVRQLSDIIAQSEVERIWTDFLGGRTSWSRPWSLYILKKWVEKNL